MSLSLYLLFLAVAAITVLSPGPGVVMTLSNALRYGLRGTFGGILGIAFGALVVAAISATSLGILLATSAVAFTIIKFIGAAYLLYLGFRLWRSPGFQFTEGETRPASLGRRFLEGLSLQLTNPKAIFFFLSVFPQFIDLERAYAPQFVLLVLTYSMLVVAIHCLYAAFAHAARKWLTSPRGGRILSRAAGATFMGFGAALATARQ
jgi:homoserine/homoserine lactone efflux protein